MNLPEFKMRSETNELFASESAQLMSKAQSTTERTPFQSELGNAVLAAAATNDGLSMQSSFRPQQSTHGNTVIARKLAGSAAESSSSPTSQETTAEVTGATTTSELGEGTGRVPGSDPRTFVFKTVIPNKTPGQPGGWQETDMVTLKFVHLGKKAIWACRIIVGAPLRNYLGPVDPEVASIATAMAADQARELTFEMLDCNAFKTEMAAILYKMIPGATVSSP